MLFDAATSKRIVGLMVFAFMALLLVDSVRLEPGDGWWLVGQLANLAACGPIAALGLLLAFRKSKPPTDQRP